MGKFNISKSKIEQVNDSGDNVKITNSGQEEQMMAASKPTPKASKPVFMSHAQKDKAIVDRFFTLLTEAGVQANNIFCSSLEGQGIPPGENFIVHIKGQIQKPDLVILMLSRQYFDSMFCQCELGASWALSSRILPVIIPPAEFADMKAVLTGIEAFKINDKYKLTEAYGVIKEALGITGVPDARWEVVRDKFLADIEPLLAQQKPPSKVEFAKFEAEQKRYAEAVKELRDGDKRYEELKKQYEELKTKKDRAEVLQVEVKYSSQWEQFEKQRDAARSALKNLPPVVQEMMYHKFGGGDDSQKSREYWEDVAKAKEQNFVTKSETRENAYDLNEDEPEVEDAVAELEALVDVLNEINKTWDSSEEFRELYKSKYGHAPTIDSRRFWESQLKLPAYYS